MGEIDPVSRNSVRSLYKPASMLTAVVLRMAGFLSILAAVGLALAVVAAPASAQAIGWSQPVLIFESQGTVAHPSIDVDIYGQIHAFWAFTPDPSSGVSGRQIYYARLDHPTEQPVDIYVTDESIVALQSTVNKDELALLWNGGMYAGSVLPAQLSAQSWFTPEEINKAYANSSLAVAPDSAIWMVYGDADTNAIFVRRFDPQDKIWGAPQFVANTATAQQVAPDNLRMAFSSDEVMHVVWTEYALPNGWPPTGLYYSRSADGGQNWSAPAILADGRYNTPNVVVGRGQDVYVAWTGIAGIGGKYFVKSSDGGLSWSGTTAVLAPGLTGGSEGAPNLVVDKGGTLHMLFTNNTCVYYSSLESSGWTDPDCISRSVPSSHTEHPAMTLGLGNQLHVLFWTNDRQLWYMTRQLPIPGDEPQPTSTVAVPTAVPPTTVPTLVPTATHLPDYGAPMDVNLPQQSSSWAIVGGIVPVVLLFIIAFVVKRRR